MSKEKPLVIVSGYFNPLHVGHLDMIEMGKKMGELLVIVNNDVQQGLKKGKIIVPEVERVRIVGALKPVDHVRLSVDGDGTVCKSIAVVAKEFKGREVIFGNGGDRPTRSRVPEAVVCDELGITMVFDLGKKITSSSEINKLLGKE